MFDFAYGEIMGPLQWPTGWHGEQWDFQNNEKTMEHSDNWIMTGWHGEQWDFQNNEKTMEHSDHWIT
jgi:hypothetical protein